MEAHGRATVSLTVKTSSLEKCVNELGNCKGPWFSAWFLIIKKWFGVYYWEVRDGVYKEPERPVEKPK